MQDGAARPVFMCAFFVGKPAPSSPLRGLVERIYTKDCKDRRLQGLRLCSSWAYRAANAISIGPACCKVTKALRRKFRFPSTRARSNQGWASANCPRSTSTIARLNMPRKSPASAERRYQRTARTGLAAVAIPCSGNGHTGSSTWHGPSAPPFHNSSTPEPGPQRRLSR